MVLWKWRCVQLQLGSIGMSMTFISSQCGKRLFLCFMTALCTNNMQNCLFKQSSLLPHWRRSCTSNLLSQPVRVDWHQANQSLHWLYNSRHLAGSGNVEVGGMIWEWTAGQIPLSPACRADSSISCLQGRFLYLLPVGPIPLSPACRADSSISCL